MPAGATGLLELQLSWLAAANLVAALINVGLVGYVRQYREEPGGRWFMALIASQGSICLVYGIELLVAGPFVAAYVLSITGWIVGMTNATLWLVFCLTYTGRGELLRSPPGRLPFVVSGLMVLLIGTDFLHGGMYATRPDPVTELGASVLAYEPGPVTQTANALILLYSLGSIGLLLETFLRSWPLFYRQTVALAAAPVLVYCIDPVVTVLGPLSYEYATLTTAMYGVTAIMFTYALFSGSLLELEPVTRRIGRQTALDDLAVPVVTVDDDGRLISLNEQATQLLGTTERATFGEPVETYLDEPPTLDTEPEEIELTVEGHRRNYRVVAEPFFDSPETLLGYTLTFLDITDIARREQRLSLLNRVLRHNLRNDLNVVMGHADVIAARAEGKPAELAESIAETSDTLATVSDTARQLDQILATTSPDQIVTVRELFETRIEPLREEFPDASVVLDGDQTLSVRTDPKTLGVVIEHLVQNGIEHNDSPESVVRVEFSKTTEGSHRSVRLDVHDNGPGIPKSEIDVIRSGEETQLEHGSGIGLWVVKSGVRALGGELSFDSSRNGTTVSLWLPAPADDARTRQTPH